MARWKYGSDGQLYYDQNDDGPDQGTPSPEQLAAQQSTSTTSTTQPATDWSKYATDISSSVSGNTGINGGAIGAGTQAQPAAGYTPPGDSNLPGYGDWSTSNPWRDSLTYDQIKTAPLPNNWGDQRDQSTPEQGYYTDGGIHTMQYTPEQAKFDDAYNNYWAPDRAQVLASLRYGAGGSKGGLTLPTTASPTATTATSAPGAVPEGFTAEKWNDPNKHDPKYDAGHMLAAGKSVEEIGQYIQKTYPGYTYLGGDKMKGPDGYIYDFAFGHDAGINKPMWEQVGGGPAGGSTTAINGGTPMNGTAPGIPGTQSLTGSMGSGLGSTLSGLFGGDAANSLYNMLMQRAGQSLSPSAQDPIIANQVNAYSAQQQRAGRDYIDDLAESRGPISNLQGEKRLMAEKLGQNVGGFQAQLMQREVDARRQEIQQALSGMMGFLTEEQRMNLQRELEYLNMSQRAYEFDTNDEFRRSPLAS